MARKNPVPTAISRNVDDLLRFLAAPHPSWTKAMEESQANPPLWVFESDSPIKTAGYLIDQAGSVKAARACITMAARLRKNPQGRPANRSDGALLIRAITIWQNDKPRSRAEAMRRAGKELGYTDADIKNAVRRLRDK
jgi:hypothetical protein